MGSPFRIGSWLVQPDLNTALRDDTSVHLTPKVMQVLVCLAEHAGQPVRKEMLIQTVWPDTFVSDDVLKGSVSELRRVFEDDAREPHIIQTIPKRGYRLIARVEWVDESGRMQEVAVQPKAAPRPIKNARTLWIVASVVAAAVIGAAVLLEVAAKRTRQMDTGAAQIRSLAVLPLANFSGDPAQEYFSDGITDTLITDLAQIGSLKVVSRTSSMQYKQTKKSLQEIARELNVDGIVEGSVQRSGNRVLVTAQLVHGPTDKHVWANSYQRDMQDVFLLERDVAGDIAEQVKARITAAGQAVPAPRAIKPEALEAYLQGNYYLNRGSGDRDVKKAQRFFQQAADADPGFVRAYVGLAWSHYSLIGASAEDRKIRQAAAEKALALDPMSPEAHSALAQMKFADWDFHGAEVEWRQAISLSPNSLEGRDGLCMVLNVTLRLEESLPECNIAQMLDPDNDHLSQTFEARRQYDRAIESLERQTRHHPDDGFLHYFLFRDYLLKGMYHKSMDELEHSLTLLGRAEVADAVRTSYASAGSQGALRTLAAFFEQSHKAGQLFLPRVVAEVYAQLGNKDRAFYWLEQGYVHHDRIGMYGGLEFITIEHILDPLTSDRRYKDLLDQIGLPDEEPGHSTKSAASRKIGTSPLPMDPKAVQAFLQGRYHFDKHGRGFGDEEKRKATAYFEQAIVADPGFAPSYNWLALPHENLWLGTKEDIAAQEKSSAKIRAD